ncbi:MAG: hypothetical protein Q4B84_05355, partial [Clostridia bacterium]|nr:hypothetical protein [Clostridia bacterium]
ISILNLKNNKGIRVASFGKNKSLTKFLAEHGRKYIPNLSENLDEIRRYVNRKVNGSVDSTSESYDKTINSSTEFSSEEMPASSKIDEKNYKRSFYTPTKVALAGAGVKPINHKKNKKSNISIPPLKFDENKNDNINITGRSSKDIKPNIKNQLDKNINHKVEETNDSKLQEQVQIYIDTPKTESQNNNEVIEQYKEETKIEINENNSMILPSDKKDEVAIVLSTENLVNEKEHLIPKEDEIKKKKGCCVIL